MRRPAAVSVRIFAVLGMAVGMAIGGCAATRPQTLPGDPREQVIAAEQAFARTMADRDHQAFASFVADDAIFFGGPEPLRGKQQVVDGWAPFFEGSDAPFSWEPAEVEVLDSGTLALSSGPVRNSDGELVARFTSIWRREADGTWRVIFDKGCDVCRDGER
jgi:ketosteroid isomerase-like protein